MNGLTMKRPWILWLPACVATGILGFHLGHQQSPLSKLEREVSLPTPLLGNPGEPTANLKRREIPNRQDTESVVMDALAHAQAGLLSQTDAIKALSLLEQLRDEDIMPALAFLEKRADGPRQQGLRVALITRLAESAPAKALAHATEHMQGLQRKIALKNILGSWAAKDPAAAWAWYEQNQNDDGRAALGVIFGALGRHDFGDALRKLSKLEAEERAAAVEGLGMLAYDDDKRLAALREVRNLPDDALQAAATKQLLSQWASFDPKQAAKWLDGAGIQEAEKARLEETVAETWLQADPKSAAEWMIQRAEPEDRPGKINQIVSSWVYQAPNEAAAWMGQFQPSEAIDDALTTLSLGIMRRDGESAFAWANRITDLSKREVATRNVFLEWYQRDPSAASSFLRKSSIPAEQIERLSRLAAAGRP